MVRNVPKWNRKGDLCEDLHSVQPQAAKTESCVFKASSLGVLYYAHKQTVQITIIMTFCQ